MKQTSPVLELQSSENYELSRVTTLQAQFREEETENLIISKCFVFFYLELINASNEQLPKIPST